MLNMIYADNAATTKLDMDAFEAMKPFLLEEYGNASQLYSFASSAKRALKKARETIANCIGAFPDEIYFTSGGTESDNWAIKIASGEGDIITSSIEHHAILNACNVMEKKGRSVNYIPVSREGIVELEYLEKSVTEKTRLISIMYANNEIGTIQPIKQIAEIAHKNNCLFHTDAVQAVGHVCINVRDLDIDLLSASAHKFNGPKGVGFLYVKKGTQISAYLNGGSQEKGLRAGTENVAGIVAMAVALEKNCNAINENREKIKKLEEIIINKLDNSGVKYIRNGSEDHIPGNVSVSFKGLEGEMILHRMDIRKICIATGAACDSVNTNISHVLKAICVPEEYIKGTIRISLGKDNTEQEIKMLTDALIQIVSNTDYM